MPGQVTMLLARWAEGDRAAFDAVMPIVHAELRKIADAYLRRERPAHTLQPTALVNEAWMRLVGTDDPHFDHRKQFFALAARIMRGILVDHERATRAEKRGGLAPHTTIDETIASPEQPVVDLLALDEALSALAARDERQARIIELKYFAGLTIDELAGVLGVSPATISRDQQAAEAWLGHAMSVSRAPDAGRVG